MKDKQFSLTDLVIDGFFWWCLAWFLGLVTVFAILGLAMISGWFVSMAAVAGLLAFGGHALNYLMPAAIIRGLAFLRTLGRYGDLMVSHHTVFGLLKTLRVTFFKRWSSLRFLQRQAQNQTSGQKMHRLVKDIDTLDEFTLRLVSPWVMALGAVSLVSLIMVLFLPKAALVVVLLVVALGVAAVTLWRGRSLAEQESLLTEERKAHLLDNLPALTQLLIWRRWQDQTDKLMALEARHTDISLKSQALRRLSMLAIQIVLALAAVLFLWLAGAVFQAGVTSFSLENLNHYQGFTAALALAVLLGLVGLGEFIQSLVSEPLALGRSLMAKKRLNDLVTSNLTNKKERSLDGLYQQKLGLELIDLVVKAPNAILSARPLTARIQSGQPCLIVGPSGSGKSTLLHTLAGEYAPKSGQANLLGDLGRADWFEVDFGKQLGFLGQTVDIFDQTLADNLRLGKFDATDQELYAVLDAVNLGDWVRSQPKGLDTPLGEYGAAISGGQARRVALARLLLAPKSVLLLDEPFAGLDTSTRQVVWQSLTQAQKQGKIGLLVICTHQVWEQMQPVDQIFVG